MSGERRTLLNFVGVNTEVRDEVHAHTNHYIEQSRPYFPNAQLPKYIHCPYFLRIAQLVCFASLICTLVVKISGSASKAIPIGFFGACLLFFFIYCQHERVNQMSLPLVLKQPVFDSQRRLNEFYQLTVTELDGIALQNYQAGFGFIPLTQGKIKIQAFNRKAIRQMSDAKCQSRWMLVLFLLSVIYNGFFYILPYL